MNALSKLDLVRGQQPATLRPDVLFRRQRIVKRYGPLFLMWFVLGSALTAVSVSRLAAGSGGKAARHEPASQEPARKAGLSWAQGRQSDLRGRTMAGASLTGADLQGADLGGSDMAGAVLLGTHLRNANLRGAVLRRADLHYAILAGADLRGADLCWANLQWVDLQDADLRGARLTFARLHRAHLQGAILPNGTRWVPGRDLERFTDPSHPEYWRGKIG
jgi:uncharacterized protein YjbI with pentapeptide repeats